MQRLPHVLVEETSSCRSENIPNYTLNVYCNPHQNPMESFCNVNPDLNAIRFIYLPILSFVFLGLHSQHMEVPSLGVESELQLLA